MPTFKYQALSDGGTSVTGTVVAKSPDEAKALVAAKGFVPTKVSQTATKAAPGDTWMDQVNAAMTPVKAPDLILFTKQFRTMFVAGINVTRTLSVLEHQTSNLRLKRAIPQMKQDIQSGSSLYQAFSRHPKSFPELYCRMVRAGEISGNLPEVLDRLIYLINHEFKVRKQIKSALTYPIIVVTMLVGAFFFLLTGVIPKFVKLFESAHVELPWPTQVCMTMHHAIQQYWHFGLGGIVVGLVGLIMYLRTPQGQYNKARFMLSVPLIGPVVQKGAMSRFSSIFALLQSSGVSVLESVTVISKTIGNAAISREFDHLEQKLKEGRGISAPLQASKFFTPMVVNMVAIGEETGNLDELLTEVSHHYDYEVEYAVSRMTDMIGPIMTLSLAGVVAFFALAVMLPIFDLMKTTGL